MVTSTDDFFRSRLGQTINLRHPLAVLSSRVPWQEIESSLARAAKAGKQIEDIDLFSATVSLSGGGISKAGRPRLPLRLMVSLLI
jgi:IS5 family transposase